MIFLISKLNHLDKNVRVFTILNIICEFITRSNNFSNQKFYLKGIYISLILFYLLFMMVCDGICIDWGEYKLFWDSLSNFDNFIFNKSQLLTTHAFFRQDPFYLTFIRFIHDNISRNYTVYLLIFLQFVMALFYSPYQI